MSFWDRLGDLTKAGPPPPKARDEEDDGDDGDGGEGGPPDENDFPKMLPPARDLPEPQVGSGPTLAAPAQSSTQQLPIRPLEKPAEEPEAMLWDPYSIVDALGYKDKNSQMSFNTIRFMFARMPILEAIVKTRIDQVVPFAEVQQDEYSTGFHIQSRERTTNPTPAMKRRMQEIERWLLTTGTTNNPLNRDSFATFLKKVVRDSLMFDQCAWEICRSRTGKPATFYALDGTSIRIADTVRLWTDPEDQDAIRHVQVYDGLVVTQWRSGEVQFGVRNPETDMRLQGYGVSETEKLIRTITALLYAWDYNQKFFMQGTASKGIINFKGAIPQKHLRAFRRHWYMMTSGVENAFRTPIVNAEELQYVNLQLANKDMEYSAWFDFLIKVACAVYGMDPMEVNFKYGDSGGSGKAMFESNNTAKLSASKDKGLKPLLKFLEERINASLIWPLEPDMEFQFMGLEADSKSEEADLLTKQVKTYLTINEIRARKELAPLPNGQGDIILDPTYMQHLTLATQQQAMHDQASQIGEEPPDGPPGDEGGTSAGDDMTDQDPEDVVGEVMREAGPKAGKPPSAPDDDEAEKALVVDLEW